MFHEAGLLVWVSNILKLFSLQDLNALQLMAQVEESARTFGAVLESSIQSPLLKFSCRISTSSIYGITSKEKLDPKFALCLPKDVRSYQAMVKH
jgi:hypothetical protein